MTTPAPEAPDGRPVNPATGEIVDLCDANEARLLTDRIVAQAETLWDLLWESYHRHAWAALGYPSWRAYATAEFGMSESKAYRLLHHAGIVKELKAAGDPAADTITEGQTRHLRDGHAADDLDTAREASGDPDPSGPQIRESRTPEPQPDPEPPVSPHGELLRLAVALETLTGRIAEAWTGGDDTARAPVKRSTRQLADLINAQAKPARPARPHPKTPKKTR